MSELSFFMNSNVGVRRGPEIFEFFTRKSNIQIYWGSLPGQTLRLHSSSVASVWGQVGNN